MVKAIITGILFLASLSNDVFAFDFQPLETRYGKIDVVSNSEKISTRHHVKVILATDADGASLFRITSDTRNEYVIVNFSHGGLNCRGFFQLIELSLSDVAKISKEFGECYEFGGAGFVAADPVVHLKQAIDGKPVETISFLWRDGRISKIFESTDSCRSLGFSATTVSKKVNSNMEQQVGGAGRLQFYSAPNDACAKNGVFILPGERLTLSLRFEDFVYVTYKNPKTATQTQGWVHADRLSSTKE